VSRFVLDVSVAASFLLPDECFEPVEPLLLATALGHACAPDLFAYELINVIVTASRKGRIATAQVDAALLAIADLPVALVSPSLPDAVTRIGALARRHDLTAYDAAYLDLAMTLAVRLATLDAHLRRACDAEGVVVLP
jgi:predicted nucleic acid-binding protein